MKVRAIRDHYNSHGHSFFKSGSAGPVYDLPDVEAKPLIKRGYVEDADASQAERLSRTGPSAERATTGNGQERAAPSGKGRPGANGKRSGSKGAGTNG